MSGDDRNERFCNRVRDAYQEIYGNDGLETDEPFTMGTTLVLLAADYLDGDTSSIMIYDGRRLEALGLAREAVFFLLPD